MSVSRLKHADVSSLISYEKYIAAFQAIKDGTTYTVLERHIYYEFGLRLDVYVSSGLYQDVIQAFIAHMVKEDKLRDVMLSLHKKFSDKPLFAEYLRKHEGLNLSITDDEDDGFNGNYDFYKDVLTR